MCPKFLYGKYALVNCIVFQVLSLGQWANLAFSSLSALPKYKIRNPHGAEAYPSSDRRVTRFRRSPDVRDARWPVEAQWLPQTRRALRPPESPQGRLYLLRDAWNLLSVLELLATFDPLSGDTMWPFYCHRLSFSENSMNFYYKFFFKPSWGFNKLLDADEMKLSKGC